MGTEVIVAHYDTLEWLHTQQWFLFLKSKSFSYCFIVILKIMTQMLNIWLKNLMRNWMLLIKRAALYLIWWSNCDWFETTTISYTCVLISIDQNQGYHTLILINAE